MPIARTIKFKHESASAVLHLYSANEGILMDVTARQRRLGHGSVLMQTIVEYADMNGVDIELYAQAYDEGADGLPNKKLRDFYAKFGFEIVDKSIRAPWKMQRLYSREKHCS